ncbi:radical SAM/SPASM domain-containing protein [Selenomonas sp. KH1T6]|uniref:radical SAM/SPASM domain-containing protein n=1 Tax=Selenomonas sp. KH1T6 TaxID=3158784 RepID=UPI0008A762E1|nr:uncharacterized protein SAMN05216583_12140 [Selenomonas ruminantium]
MRTSTYEIILPLTDGAGKEIEGRVLLVNGLYGAMDVVSGEEAEKFKAGDFAGLPMALRERLMLRGHITRKDEAGEMSDLALLSRVYRLLFGRRDIALVIMPTYDCNFRCPYCFEQHRLKRGQSWLDSTMSEEVMETVFAGLEDYKKRGYILRDCTFYGGEPFLKKNLPVARKIAEHCKALDIGIDAITNGYELDTYLDFLEEYKVDHLQVTLDGVAEVNDRRRVHKEGLPTYDRILANVELALSRGTKVSLRVNVGKENLHGIGALIDDLKARGLLEKDEKRAAFKYYFKAATDDVHPEKNISDWEVFEELLKYGFTAEEAIDLQSSCSGLADNLRSLLKKKEYPSFNPGYCGSEYGMLVVDPFGKVYACWDAVGKDEDMVGIADPETGRFLWDFTKCKWRTRTTDLMEACRLCPYAFICRGGCASRAKNAYGDYFREFCGDIKETFAFITSRCAGIQWLETQEDELTLSLAGPLSRLTEAERETLMKSRSHKEIFAIVQEIGLCMEEKKDFSK